MDESLHARAVAPFDEQVARMRPPGAEVLDAHTHLGLDEDGRSLDPQALLAQLDAAGASRACVFALHDPERHPGYRVPNDRVLAWAAASGGRLIPFCRLDPAEEPVAEGERALAAGARGIKLHPRAQAFSLRGSAIEDIFALAERAAVPILLHAGRGLPPIADDLASLALRHPQVVLILAHAAIADQGTLTSRLADHPGILYDTSTWSPYDVMELFARVPAERIVFATDPPYGQPATGLYMALRVARAIGLDEAATSLYLGGTMASLMDRGELPAGAPRGQALVTAPGTMLRVFGYTLMAGPALFGGMVDVARGAVELALGACRDPDAGELAESLAVIATALQAALTVMSGEQTAGDVESTGRERLRPAIDLVQRCMALSATEHVALTAAA